MASGYCIEQGSSNRGLNHSCPLKPRKFLIVMPRSKTIKKEKVSRGYNYTFFKLR